MPKVTALKPESLRCACNPELFNFADTSELEPLDDVIGQQRAVNAIDFGLNMAGAGYHIFVTGQPGTGKTTIIQDIVNKHARNRPAPHDWCMVNNFKEGYRPIAVAVPTDSIYGRVQERLRRYFQQTLKHQAARADAGDEDD